MPWRPAPARKRSSPACDLGQRAQPVLELVGDRRRLVEPVLLEHRQPVLAQARLRERARARRRAPRRRRGSCPAGTTRLASPIASASAASTGRPVRIRSIARLAPIRRGRRTVPPSISGTPQRRQNTPKHRVLLGDAQIAPQRQLQPAGDRVAGDRGDHRLGQPHPRRPHRPVAVVGSTRLPVSVPTALRSAPAQNTPPSPCSTATAASGVGVEVAERVGQGAARSGRRRRCAAPGATAAPWTPGPSRSTLTRRRSRRRRPDGPAGRTSAAPATISSASRARRRPAARAARPAPRRSRRPAPRR